MSQRQGLSFLGLGAAACVACCIGPIVAFLGGLSLAGFASTVWLGGGGLAVGVAAAAGWLVLRRRRRDGCAVESGPIRVAAPTRR